MNCKSPLYWHGCYASNYDLISPDSYAHPAKMAPALCFRILEHLKEMGFLKDSDTILDPMGGTGLTSICAGAKGYKSITVELEEKFVNFQIQNKLYAERKLFKEIDWQILQGDSRKLSELLNDKCVSVTSPPYAEAQTGGGIAKNGYINQYSHAGNPDTVGNRTYMPDTHGTTPGQIDNLKDIPLKAITSPPYQDSKGHPSLGSVNKDSWGKEGRDITARRNLTGDYGDSKEQIGNLPDKPLKAITSPPYDGDPGHHGNDVNGIRAEKGILGDYGKTDGNLGDTSGESYLSAMLQVYKEVAKVSDVLAIVIKNPTRNKQLRRLDLDTIKILELAGWSIHCQHRALLFEELQQSTLFDGTQKKVKGRMSFFKRLSWQNGQPVASWEDIVIAVRTHHETG